jgi:hypothetical protein
MRAQTRKTASKVPKNAALGAKKSVFRHLQRMPIYDKNPTHCRVFIHQTYSAALA